MRVLFLLRKGFRNFVGGDSIQVLETAQHLKKLGVQVEILEAGDSMAGKRCDIVHFFNLGRPYDLYPYLDSLRVPLVVSSLFVDYYEYDVRGRIWPVKDIIAILGRNNAEYIKATLKMAVGQIHQSAHKYLYDGHHKAIQKILQNTDCLIGATGSELERIYRYAHYLPAHVDIVPLGIDPIYFSKASPWHKRHGIISAGRLEGLKNTDKLIKAAEEIDAELTLAGKPGKNATLYCWYLHLIAGKKVQFTGQLNPTELLEQYIRHRVHAQPSWFETTGLASLEAAAAGCRIVVTNRGDTADVFGVYALYCDPSSLRDITQNLLIALETPPAQEQREYFYEHFSWEKSAEKIRQIYHKILDR